MPQLSVIANQLFHFFNEQRANLLIEWIPRDLNRVADDLSKSQDNDDWQLHPLLFKVLDQLWGPHEVDTFASARNALLPVFWSRFPPRAGLLLMFSCSLGPILICG